MLPWLDTLPAIHQRAPPVPGRPVATPGVGTCHPSPHKGLSPQYESLSTAGGHAERGDEPADFLCGWQQRASHARDQHALETHLFDLLLQAGRHARRVFTVPCRELAPPGPCEWLRTTPSLPRTSVGAKRTVVTQAAVDSRTHDPTQQRLQVPKLRRKPATATQNASKMFATSHTGILRCSRGSALCLSARRPSPTKHSAGRPESS